MWKKKKKSSLELTRLAFVSILGCFITEGSSWMCDWTCLSPTFLLGKWGLKCLFFIMSRHSCGYIIICYQHFDGTVLMGDILIQPK